MAVMMSALLRLVLVSLLAARSVAQIAPNTTVISMLDLIPQCSVSLTSDAYQCQANQY
jgi:hypothetical protein